MSPYPRADERKAMVEHQIAARGIHDPRVLAAMLEIPRHLFIPPPYNRAAYEDNPLPIGKGQTISQPYIVALMTELLHPKATDNVLEIGAGSGYQAAILSRLVRKLTTIERIIPVADLARTNLKSLGIDNVIVIEGDGTLGYPENAPYNGIIITAATPVIPQPLIGQLADGGTLVAPVGGHDIQDLITLHKKGKIIAPGVSWRSQVCSPHRATRMGDNKLMKIIDVTRPLKKDMLVYPGDITPSFNQAPHGRYLISDLHMSSHTGTHVDAPGHYLKSGKTIDTVPLSSLIGRCRVLDMSRFGTLITAEHLEGRLEGVKRLLLKTIFSGRDTFAEEYPSLTYDAACSITDTGIECVGIDSPSIESYRCDGSVHYRLLGKGCIIIELLDLSGVPEGDYEMVALPLRLVGLDGSPARVVLMNQKGK